MQMLLKELRAKELFWLFIALVLSVAALSSVSFLADRLQRSFEIDGRTLLAADLLIAADQPIAPALIEAAKSQKLNIAQTVVFPSMVSHGGESKLSSLKAVSALYPLRGQLQISRQVNDGRVDERSIEEVTGMPPKNTVWVDPAVLISLRAKLGDSLSIGDRQFRIDAVIVRELDRGAAFMNFAPRAMIGIDDLASTGLIGFGSRVTYRLLLSGTDPQIRGYQDWALNHIEQQKLRGIRIESLENAQPVMRKTLERAERFLSLVALMTALICALAIALAARRYVLKQADSCAVWKCFGASQAQILRKQLYILTMIGVVATILGGFIGWFAQELLMQLLGGLIQTRLPLPSVWPVVWSVVFALLLLFGFAGPPILTLSQISPLRLVRREFGKVPLAAKSIALFGFISCLALVFWATRDLKLLVWATGSFGIGALLFAGLAWLGLWGLERFSQSSYLARIGFVTRFAISTQSRRAAFAMIQVSSLALAIMALLLIFLLRQDLLQSWQANVPDNAPNRFLINIQNDQKAEVQRMLIAGGITEAQLYPMVRGRLTHINEREVMPDNYQTDNARRLVDREFNLSYTNQLPSDNQLVAGQWFGNSGTPQISIESGIAKTLNLRMGDQMSFDIAGQKITAPITSMRKLDWGSMQVNFFVIFPPKALDDFPKSWITSYHQPKERENLDLKLAQTYPNLTIVDIENSIRQIQEVLNRLASALGLLLVFTLCAAILVLFAAIGSTQDDRFRDAALLKAVGASKRTLAQLVVIELTTIGFLSGLLGGLAASATTWALGRYVLEIEFYSFGTAIGLGIVLGVCVSLLAGFRLQQKIQTASTMECLREV